MKVIEELSILPSNTSPLIEISSPTYFDGESITSSTVLVGSGDCKMTTPTKIKVNNPPEVSNLVRLVNS